MATQPPQRRTIKVIETHGATAQAMPDDRKAIEVHGATAQAMPDDRLLLTLDDGRSIVIDGERLAPQEDGTYQVALVTADLR